PLRARRNSAGKRTVGLSPRAGNSYTGVAREDRGVHQPATRRLSVDWQAEDTMFRHFLVPTDGSPRADAMIERAMAFPGRLGARVTGLHVIPQYHLMTYRLTSLQDTQETFAAEAARHADEFLGALSRAATQAGVPCETVTATDDHPWHAIVQTAQ